MTGKKPPLKNILTTIYIGNVAFILFFYCFLFGYFKSTDPNSQMVAWTLGITIYASFFSAGVDLLRLYSTKQVIFKPMKKFVFTHPVGVGDMYWVVFSAILATILYFYRFQPIWEIVALIFVVAIAITGSRIWKRLTKKYKRLRKLES